MTYPIINNVTGLGTVATYMNTVTNDLYWTIMFVVLWLVILGISMIFPRIEAIVITALIGFVASVILASAGLVGSVVVIACVIIWALGILLLWFSKE